MQKVRISPHNCRIPSFCFVPGPVVIIWEEHNGRENHRKFLVLARAWGGKQDDETNREVCGTVRMAK